MSAPDNGSEGRRPLTRAGAGTQMSFAGNLASVSFGDILQLVSTGQKTGALLLGRGRQKKRIYFRNGQVIYAVSEAVDQDRLGQLLVRQGKLTPEQLETVLTKQRTTKKRIGEIVVEMRLVEAQELALALQLQVEEIIHSIFAWGDGEFQFRDGEVPPPKAPLTEINTMTLMMEGARRFDEWSRIRDALPSAETVLQMRSTPLVVNQEITLSPEEVEILATIDGRRRIDEILEAGVRGEYSAAHSLFKLLELGLVEPASQVSPEESEREEVAGLLDLVFKLYAHSLSRIQQELAEMLGEGGQRLFLRVARAKLEKGLFDSLAAGETATARDHFLRVAEAVPENVRVHKVLSQSAALLRDRLDLVRDCLGEQAARRVAELIRKDVAFLLAQKRALADKYDIGGEFAESLKGP